MFLNIVNLINYFEIFREKNFFLGIWFLFYGMWEKMMNFILKWVDELNVFRVSFINVIFKERTFFLWV